LLANLGDAAQNQRENRIKPFFRSLVWEHLDRPVSKTVLERWSKIYSKKQNHFK